MPEGTTLGKYYIQIVPTTQGITNNIAQEMSGYGEQGGKSFGSSFSSALGSAAKVGAASIAAVGTATIAAGGYMLSAAGSAAAYGDAIDKNSQKLGISAEAYQEWEAVMQHSGTSMESMSATFKTLSNAAQDASDDQVAAFQRLGLSMEDVASMTTEDLFAAVISGLQGMEEGTERTALATDLLGRGAMEMGALLNTSSEDTQAMRDRVRELGGVMSNDAVKAAAAYQDSLQDMQTAFSSLSRNLVTEFLPGITSVMDGLTDLFAGDSEGGLAQISEGIDSIITGITEKLPEFLDVGIEIIDSILDAIIENLPKLLDAGSDAVMTIVDGLLDNLPEIVQTGLEVIVSLAQGIADNLPELIPTIVDVILEIVNILTDPDNLSSMIDAALQIILALAEGLIRAIPQLIQAVPQIIANLIQAIVTNAPKLLSSGMELVKTLANGILNSARMLMSAGPQLISQVIQGIRQRFQNLTTIGQNIVIRVKNGFVQKIRDAWQWGKDLIQNFINGLKSVPIVGAVSGIAGTVKKYLGFSEPELGPLSNFHTFAPDMMQLWAKGIYDNVGLVEDAMRYTTGSVSANMAAVGAGQTANTAQVSHDRTYSDSRQRSIEDALARIERAISNAGGKGNEVVFNVNGREFCRAIWNDSQAVAREKGMSLIIGHV